MAKESFKVQDRLRVTEYIKCTDMASECTLQLIFKTKATSLSSNGESKNIHN